MTPQIAFWAGGWRYRLHAGAAFGWGAWSRPYERQGEAWRAAINAVGGYARARFSAR